jgi:hypothetical protein
MEPRKFITAFTRTCHQSLSWARSIQSTAQSKSEALWNVLQNSEFLRWGVVSTSPNPQAGGPPLVDFLRLIIQYIHSYAPYWRRFLHPQPKDAPCRGDRDTLITKECKKQRKQRRANNFWIRWVACEGVEGLGDGVVYIGRWVPEFQRSALSPSTWPEGGMSLCSATRLYNPQMAIRILILQIYV